MEKSVRQIKNRIISSRNILLLLSVCSFYLFLYHFPSIGNATEVNSTADADRFLKQSLGAEQRGLGGSFVASTGGANAIGSNPAGISITEGNRFVIHMARFPRMIAKVSKPNVDANFEDFSQYEQLSSGIEILKGAFPIGRFGTLGVSLSSAHEGSFRRVSHEGEALNNFSDNDIAAGIGYGIRFIEGTLIGFDAKWLRSKVTDITGKEHFGRGYAYNVGLIQKISDTIQVGIVLRNLSNGLSFVDSRIPDRINRDVVVGVTYQRNISDFAFRIGLDLHPPFTDGVSTNLGAEVWYQDRICGRIGYLRDNEERHLPVMILEESSVEFENRGWKSEGLCLGLGIQIGNFMINASHTPQFTPTVSEDERLHIVKGASVYTFSIGNKF